MVDGNAPAVTAPEVPVVAPVVAAPVVAEAAAPAPAEVVVAKAPDTPVEAPAADAAPVAPAAEAPQTDKPAEPAEAAPAAEDAKPIAPIYTEFKMPEGLKADTAVITAYTNVLGKHNISQEAGQELIDFHANAMKQAVEQMGQQQQDIFAETRRGWIKDFDKQAGNRRDTILNDAKFAVAEVVKDKKDREAFWSVLNFTGAGDHPAVINAWAKVGKRLREREAPPPGLPNNGAKGGRPEDRRYASKS